MTMAEPPSLSWRTDDNDKPPTPRQGGIAPKQFHAGSSNRRPRQQRFLNKVLEDSANNVIRQQRKQVTTLIKLKRAAYKEVTSLKTWPLQELALKDLDHWTMVHLGKHHDSTTTSADAGGADGVVVPDVETHGDSTGLSSSSLEEPKRLRRKDSDDEEDLSPRKSTQRHQFKHEFIRERDMLILKDADEQEEDDDDNDDTSPSSLFSALWCMEPRIFAVEKSSAGKRKYMVGHLGRFLDYYWRKVDPNQRHYYELIREKTPCRLYLDLEFSKISNPDISEEDSEQLMDEFLQELMMEFQTIYNLHVSQENMVDLDSSTDTKFSRHIVVHLPGGALFADAVAVGRFVRVFVGRLAEEVATGTMMTTKQKPALAKHLFVNSAPSRSTKTTPPSQESVSKTCFVDLGVYTRNRLFRLMGASKFGKPPSAALRIAPTNQFPLAVANESFYLPALEKQGIVSGEQKEGEGGSGVSSKKEEKKNVLDDDMKRFMSSQDWTAHAEALAATLVVPMNVSKRNFPILADSEAAKAIDETCAETPSSASLALSVATTRSTAHSTAVKTGRSLFPFLDNYVLNKLATRGGVQGNIRGWSMDYHENGGGNNKSSLCKSITYQMSRNRWCESIGRPHKSNNIMWTIDFTTMEVTQGCHDPECRSMRFRGQPTLLPADVQEELRDALFEQELAQLPDEAESIKKKSPTSQFEFDDAEFERALLALKINGDDTPKKSNVEASTEKPSSRDEFEALDDDALWNATQTSPELFP
jgi:hypothetical protein